MPCIHSDHTLPDASDCSLCKHGPDLGKLPRGWRTDSQGRAVAKPANRVKSRKNPDATTLHAIQILEGKRCRFCGTLKENHGRCLCMRRVEFSDAEEAIGIFAKRNAVHKDTGSVATSAVRRASLIAGRDIPVQHGADTRPLVADAVNTAVTRYELPDRWQPRRSSRADDLPV